jgi:hypothetical protein
MSSVPRTIEAEVQRAAVLRQVFSLVAEHLPAVTGATHAGTSNANASRLSQHGGQKVSPVGVLFVFRTLFPDVQGESEDAVKATIADCTHGGDMDFSQLTIFEAAAVFDRDATAYIVTPDIFAECFDDRPVMSNALAIVRSAITRVLALNAALDELQTAEKVARSAICSLERDNVNELSSHRRRAVDIARLREQIYIGGLRFRRERQLEQLLGTDAWTKANEELASMVLPGAVPQHPNMKAEIEKSHAEASAALATAEWLEVTCSSIEHAITLNDDKLRTLRKWRGGAFALAKQQCQDSMAAIIAEVNTQRPSIDHRLGNAERRLAEIGAQLLSQSFVRDADAARQSVKSVKRAHLQSTHADVFSWIAETNALNWETAIRLPLDHRDLVICDPSNTDSTATSGASLTHRVTQECVYLFCVCAQSSAAAQKTLELQNTQALLEQVKGVTMPRRVLAEFFAHHQIDVPGTAKLFVDEYAVRGEVNFDGFVRMLHDLAVLAFGPRAHQFSGSFTVHCYLAGQLISSYPRFVASTLEASAECAHSVRQALDRVDSATVVALWNRFRRTHGSATALPSSFPSVTWLDEAVDTVLSTAAPTAAPASTLTVPIAEIAALLRDASMAAVAAEEAGYLLRGNQLLMLSRHAVIVALCALVPDLTHIDTLFCMTSDESGFFDWNRRWPSMPAVPFSFAAGAVASLLWALSGALEGLPKVRGAVVPLLAVEHLAAPSFEAALRRSCTMES